MWFETLMGFSEITPQQVRENISVDGNKMTSLMNGRTFICGELETPTLAELRERVHSSDKRSGKLSVREVVADVHQLHTKESNAGALSQVASQFNLLEMVGPDLTPEQGVGIYELDHTQGPSCAIAAGAGTIYRNYFAVVNGVIGQSEENQIDCLADLGEALGNADGRLWEMRNGYALASRNGLEEISKRLRHSSQIELDQLRQQLRIGIQWDTQVTLEDCKHTVSQAYCSALPVAYSQQPLSLWAVFARLVLEASYEAAICAAILNSSRNGNITVYLTLLGGGAFGNADQWILDAIKRALKTYKDFDLDVAIVSYRRSNPKIQMLIDQINNKG